MKRMVTNSRRIFRIFEGEIYPGGSPFGSSQRSFLREVSFITQRGVSYLLIRCQQKQGWYCFYEAIGILDSRLTSRLCSKNLCILWSDVDLFRYFDQICSKSLHFLNCTLSLIKVVCCMISNDVNDVCKVSHEWCKRLITNDVPVMVKVPVTVKYYCITDELKVASHREARFPRVVCYALCSLGSKSTPLGVTKISF